MVWTWGFLLASILLLVVGLATAAPAQAPLGFTYSSPPALRVPDASAVACGGTVEVPILAKNHELADGAFLSVEFDQELVGYAWYKSNDFAWRVERAVPYGEGRVTFRLRKAPGWKGGDAANGGRGVLGDGGPEDGAGDTAEGGLSPDALSDRQPGEEVLIVVVFYVRTACRSDQEFVRRSEIRLGEQDPSREIGDSYLFLSGLGEAYQAFPTRLTDGSLSIYYQDGLELGWGALTQRAQEFTLPLYLTSIDPARRLFLVGVDYDELFLNVTGVRTRRPAVEGSAGDSLRELGEGRVLLEIELPPEAEGPLCGRHVADIGFRYNGESPPHGELLVTAQLLRSRSEGEPPAAGGEGGDADSLADTGGAGGSYGEAIPGIVKMLPAYFVRGNADSSPKVRSDGRVEYLPDLVDAHQILQSIFLGAAELPCRDAADVNNNGSIEVTDVIRLLNYFYRSGPPPRAPFPLAGLDSQSDGFEDSLDCKKPVPIFRPLSTR